MSRPAVSSLSKPTASPSPLHFEGRFRAGSSSRKKLSRCSSKSCGAKNYDSGVTRTPVSGESILTTSRRSDHLNYAVLFFA